MEEKIKTSVPEEKEQTDSANRTENSRTEKTHRQPVLMIILISGLMVALVAILAVVGLRYFNKDALIKDEPKTETVSSPESQPETEAQAETVQETQIAGSEKLEQLAELYTQNADLCGWLTIEGTQLDYPVMYTPDEPERYLRQDFENNYDINGLPFVDSDCSMNPESDNLIIYGHNMVDGSMFRSVMMYEDENHWKEHPVILMYTLDEMREYEVLAAFYDRVYYTYENCFKFYQFIDAEDEAHFNEAIEYYKSKSVYDTGVTAEYGDRLLTLVTCSYHHEHGRFVVVARAKKN